LEIIDAKGKLIRKYSSNDQPRSVGAVNIPLYWVREEKTLSDKAGAHRFLWDLKYAPLDLPLSYPIAAIYKNTEPSATAPWVMPGIYTAKLSNGKGTWIEQFTVKMDPRVKTPLVALQKQHDLSLLCYERRKELTTLIKEIHAFRVSLQSQLTSALSTVADKLGPMEKEAGQLENTAQGSQEPSFGRLSAGYSSMFGILQSSDWPPTSQTTAAAAELEKQYNALMAKWKILKNKK
ncbi:MAG TPA: hypothetical protein VLJ68_10530, partial [Chitinophagaceae bacterium]|nr:hypothetical protein [Chitinophagaceae bacterium]